MAHGAAASIRCFANSPTKPDDKRLRRHLLPAGEDVGAGAMAYGLSRARECLTNVPAKYLR